MIAPLSKRPDVKYGCKRDGLTQLPKSNWIESNPRKAIPAATVTIATAIACRWNTESVNCFLNPRIAAAIKTSEEMANSRSAICQSNRLPCHSTSPRQKLAIKSDQKTHNPRGLKIGCCHHSTKGFRVQSKKAIFAVDPVKSPNCSFSQTIQLPIGTAAHKRSAASAIKPLRGVRRTIATSLARMTATAMTISGKFDSLVRYVEAIATPVTAPSNALGVFVRNHCKMQRNNAPKQSGESTALV